MDISSMINTPSYGPAPESPDKAHEWLESHERCLGHFINGQQTRPPRERLFDTINPGNGEILASVAKGNQADVDLAVKAARDALSGWSNTSPAERARILYAIARTIQRHSRLLAVLESLDNGKPIRETRDIDIPLVARHFYYHAGAAMLAGREMSDRVPIGVCGQIIPWNFPLLMLAWKIAPAIAMGNTVVLKPAEYTPLTAMLFAELVHLSGLPPGVVNIVNGGPETGEHLVGHQEVNKIAFTGSTSVGRRIRTLTAGSGKSLTLELGGKSPFIVFDDADLDSAIEGLVDAIWLNQGEVCCAGSRLLVQESIAGPFHDRVLERMKSLRVGDPLDKGMDIGAVVSQVQLDRITGLVGAANGDGGVVHQPCRDSLPVNGCYYPPTLITGLSQSSRLMQEEIFGPVLVSATFRTPDEAVMLANNTRYGLAASVWSENINLALDVAPRLACGVVWINSTNLFDAASGFGGRRESGFGREGGWEGLSAYTRFRSSSADGKDPSENHAMSAAPACLVDRTAKQFIGGRQARPDSGYMMPVHGPDCIIGHVGQGNRKDARNAVAAAAGAITWQRMSGHGRAQIVYYIAENLAARSEEFAHRIILQTGCKPEMAEREVTCSVDRLFTYAAWADKYDGKAHNVPIRGIALAMNEPVGIVAALCPTRHPLLGMISLLAPLMAMGNRCVIVPSEMHPLSTTDFYQVIETSDVPPGVVNFVSGQHSELGPVLAGHLEADAIWCFGTRDLIKAVELESAGNLKRCWSEIDGTRDWLSEHEGEGHAFLEQATDVKNIWIPYGE